MKPPVCKICGKAHWTYDGHSVSEVQVPEYVKEMARGALGRGSSASEVRGRGGNVVEPPIPKTATSAAEPSRSAIKRTEPLNGQNKRTRGRPKKWASEAERKRAYRGRHGA